MPASTAPQPILTEFKGGVARLIFNNPARHNAMSLEMWTHGAELLEAFGRDDNIRAILLTGAGSEAFVAGADISKFGDERASREAVETYDRAVARFQQVMRDLEKPTIARIDGFCIGGGLAIAIECDIRVCSEKSSFSVPAAKLGIGYAMDGIRRLRTLVGPAFAAEIFYTARRFSAQEAVMMGLVNRVLPDAELDKHVEDLLSRISENAPLAIQTAKRALIELEKPEDARDSASCDALVLKCMESEDYVEGRTAFMEKRKPVFKGR